MGEVDGEMAKVGACSSVPQPSPCPAPLPPASSALTCGNAEDRGLWRSAALKKRPRIREKTSQAFSGRGR